MPILTRNSVPERRGRPGLREHHVERFEWTSDLETGLAEIDEQHRSLFALANELQAAIASEDAPDEAVADCVWGLTDYVVQHFADEEEMMEAAGYPELPVHRSLHQQLTGETMRITARFMNEEPLTAVELGPLVARWLREHIGAADKRFVAYLASQG